MSGPYETERQARAASLYAQQDSRTDIRTANMADLAAALSGLDLGAYDERIAGWLAGWEPATVAVICGWLTRARRAGLAADEQTVMLAALEDAATAIRERAAWCDGCKAHPADLCDETADQLRRAEAYDALAAQLGGAQ